MTLIKYLVSDTVGWTVGTKEGNSAFLDPSQRIEASKVVDAVIESLEEGRDEYKSLGHLEEIDTDVEKAAAAERAAQLARIQPDGDVLDEDEVDDDEVTGGDDADIDKGDPDRMREGEGGVRYDPSEHKVDEVLDYLKLATDPDEVARVKTLEAASSRASTQIAAFEPASPDADQE